MSDGLWHWNKYDELIGPDGEAKMSLRGECDDSCLEVYLELQMTDAMRQYIVDALNAYEKVVPSE